MKNNFTDLTKEDVEYLRNKPLSVSEDQKGIYYNFTDTQINDAIKHLKTLYNGEIRKSFAVKILILNKLY